MFISPLQEQEPAYDARVRFMKLSDITKPAVTIEAAATFKDAVAKMITEQTNSLLVVDHTGVLVGEISVTDLLDAIVPEYMDGDAIAGMFATSEMFGEAIEKAATTLISDFMQKDFCPIEQDAGLMSLAQTAISCDHSRIPVVNTENKPVGIISRRGIKQLIGTYLHISDNS